jgi:glycosyltransferase involved in cell wall biosynthesis
MVFCINKLNQSPKMLSTLFQPFALRHCILESLPKRTQSSLSSRFNIKSWVRRLPSSLTKLGLLLARPFTQLVQQELIIGYIPTGSEGWVLQYLFEDIAKYASNCKFVQARSIYELQLHYYLSKKAIIFSMNQSSVPSLIWSGFPPEDIVSFYTHSRLGHSISDLRSIRAVLPMNSSEATALALAHLEESKIRVFPAGFDKALFSLREVQKANSRNIDILFVCRYVTESNSHYHRRKNYQLIIPLAKELAVRGLKVCILGKGWADCGDISLSNLTIISAIPHSEYPKVYTRSKLLICPSLQEGGPVSWLEAMACGCLTLSNPTGFPMELQSGQLGSYLMTLNAHLEDWVQEIYNILDIYSSLDPVDMDARNEFLSAASFDELAATLELIAMEPGKLVSSLTWPVFSGSVTN